MLDVLSIVAHPDDTELTCGGTVIKMAEAGYKVGVLDLTAGESGTRGNALLREREAAKASKVMGLAHRENLGLPDAGIENTREHKLKIAEVPITLHPDGRKAHSPHLKTFRDGWRTLRLFFLCNAF